MLRKKAAVMWTISNISLKFNTVHTFNLHQFNAFIFYFDRNCKKPILVRTIQCLHFLFDRNWKKLLPHPVHQTCLRQRRWKTDPEIDFQQFYQVNGNCIKPSYIWLNFLYWTRYTNPVFGEILNNNIIFSWNLHWLLPQSGGITFEFHNILIHMWENFDDTLET